MGADIVPERPKVAVVILSWNGRDDTLACVESVLATRDETVRVIVVDNGSSDGTSEAIHRIHPDIDLVVNTDNLGFAAGNNAGLRRALDLGAEYVLVLNNDTIADASAIRTLVGALEADAQAAAACPLICFAEPPDLVWYGGATFDPTRGRSGRVSGYREPLAASLGPVREVDRGTGAAMLMRSTVLDQVGLFDDDLFLYFEDVDWSLRARRAGYGILFVPAARIWHKVSVTSGGEHSPLILYYETRNHLEVCRRHAPLGPAGACQRAAVILAVHLRQALRSANAGIS